MTLEMGKTLAESRGEVTYGAEFFRWFSEEAVRIHGRWSTAPNGATRLLTMKKPVGPDADDHAVELPAGDGHAQDRPGHRGRLHDGGQAREPDAADDAGAGRAAARVRPARGRPQRHHDLAHRRRHGAAHPRPAAAQADLHRVDRHRSPARRAVRRAAAARLDGARRQRPVHRLRGRRPRPRRRRRDARQDAQHRRGLHGGQPVLRARERRRGVREEVRRADGRRSPSARAPRRASTSGRSSTPRPATG